MAISFYSIYTCSVDSSYTSLSLSLSHFDGQTNPWTTSLFPPFLQTPASNPTLLSQNPSCPLYLTGSVDVHPVSALYLLIQESKIKDVSVQLLWEYFYFAFYSSCYGIQLILLVQDSAMQASFHLT